ncbi:MAG: L,D-transpeptidase family protein [Candidatus Riflebacteria bacterium]|nr:L,D-transpeptidase family protein [Candidatus Riflebacteria bacterium]
MEKVSGKKFFLVLALMLLSFYPTLVTGSPFGDDTTIQPPENVSIPSVKDDNLPKPIVNAENVASVATIQMPSYDPKSTWIHESLVIESGEKVIVFATVANIRQGPSTNASITTTVGIGSTFKILGKQNPWIEISLSDTGSSKEVVTPEMIEAAQDQFLSAYKVYTQSVMSAGKQDPNTQSALQEFRKKYAVYKSYAAKSKDLKRIKKGAASVEKVVISKDDFTATVYSQGKIVRVFPIAYGANPDSQNKQGENDSRTPEGTFKFERKVVNPSYKGAAWTPNSPVGTRWMQMNTWGGSIAMHGTNAPDSIGTHASHGCIRMFTPDAEELFSLIRIGTPVIIEPLGTKE